MEARYSDLNIFPTAWLQVPLSAVLLLFELTHDYFIIIPTLASVGISYWVASFPIAAVLQPLLPVPGLWAKDASTVPPSTSAVQVLWSPKTELSKLYRVDRLAGVVG